MEALAKAKLGPEPKNHIVKVRKKKKKGHHGQVGNGKEKRENLDKPKTRGKNGGGRQQRGIFGQMKKAQQGRFARGIEPNIY